MQSSAINVYPLEAYKIGQKEERPEKDATIAARFARMCSPGSVLLHGSPPSHLYTRARLEVVWSLVPQARTPGCTPTRRETPSPHIRLLRRGQGVQVRERGAAQVWGLHLRAGRTLTGD